MAKSELKTIKKIQTLSLAKIAGLFGIIYGLLIGIITSIMFVLSKSAPEIASQLGPLNQIGYYAILIFPIIQGIAYFLIGLLIGLLYNIFVKKIGGIKIELI